MAHHPRSTGRSNNTVTGQTVSRAKDEIEDEAMSLSWFHPYLTRHAADCMLIDNAPEGCYLLRTSSDYENDESFVLSVKLSSSVQHIKVTKTSGNVYYFGNSSFQGIETFRRHFEQEKPIIGGDSGVMVVLNLPYSRHVQENHLYTDITHHAVTNMINTSDSEREDSPLEDLTSTFPQAITSKEGYLTKQGRIRKTWKVRWFILRNTTLGYYKTKQSSRPVARLDLNKALAVEHDDSKKKNFCFSIKFPHRTYFIHGSSKEDSCQWVEILQSKLNLS